MSEEEDDDRMDRAKRIKRMREGDRGTDDDSSAESAADESATDDTPSDESDTDDTTSDESPTDGTDGEPGPEESEGDDGEELQEVAVPETAETEDAETTELSPDDEDISAPLPETDQLEEALEESDADAETETVTPDAAEGAARAGEILDEEEAHEEETRVLEFTLDDEHYCLDIEYIEEIVKEETITRVPNTPEHVEGVVDLRGQITTILNPKVILEKENKAAGELIIVFDSDAFEDQGHIGWIVDDVRQVSPITESDVNDPPVEDEHVNGVIDRDDDEGFVIWASPELALEVAETG